VDNQDWERDMSANRSVSGANAKEGLPPFEGLRHKNGLCFDLSHADGLDLRHTGKRRGEFGA